MNKNTVLIVVAIVCLVGAGAFIFMQLSKGKKSDAPPEIRPSGQPQQPVPTN